MNFSGGKREDEFEKMNFSGDKERRWRKMKIVTLFCSYRIMRLVLGSETPEIVCFLS